MSHGMIRFIATLFLACLSLIAQGVEVVTYYHNDALGSPIIATDQEGRVVWRKSYAPYGQPVGQTAPNEPGYTGKFEEPDLGIQNFGARWYDPRIGRFLAIDPAGFDPQNPQSFNRYAYANNNPYKYVDPDGREAIIAITPVIVPGDIDKTVEINKQIQAGVIEGGVLGASMVLAPATEASVLGRFLTGGRAVDKVDDAVSVAKAGEQLVIGRGRDLAKEGALGPGEFKLHWPPTATAKSEWKMNSGLLREELGKSRPIRDASPGDTGGMHLNAERNLLRDRGRSFDADTNLWMPPKQ